MPALRLRRRCRPYAEAIAGGVAINRCPPGGIGLIERLSKLTGQPVPHSAGLAASPARWSPGIDETLCIGCTLHRCVPVDASVGAAKRPHTVLPALCTGCELCLPPCPVDCIAMVPAGRAWSPEDARAARRRCIARNRRRARARASSATRATSSTADSERVKREAAVAAALSVRGAPQRLERIENDRRFSARPDVAAACNAGTGTANREPAEARTIFERLRAANPHPQSELAH
jgi:electron transport complex protein RnfB